MALETLSTRTNVGSALRPAEPDELFARWQKFGDRRARDELVERYMPLARRLARRYLGAREPFEDLLQVASLGLVKAIDRFDASRGNAFTSFAVPTILGELKRYFRDLGWAVHVPRGAQERALKVEEVQRELTSKTGRAPTITQVAEYMEISLEDVLDALEAAGAHHSMSLDTPRDDGESDGGTIADVLGEEDKRFEYIDAGASIAQAAQQLSERERRILALRFIEDRTQTQIAEIEGVSQMQVSRVLRRALATLSDLVETDGAPSTPGPGRQLRR
ncbi:MAG TPA: SigB/SigF/SigG family RNA polymerase sigma factor [Solirubrobacteraceae bacterium]|nr:SigB/SigF/SigG family RNA polymerase sigma factor [Solirubrobacteraceae bacterium]